MIIPASSNLTAPVLLPSSSALLSTLPSPPFPTVTPLNIFTALIPIVLSCVLQPLGTAWGQPSNYSFLLRISPITNLIDAIALLCEVFNAICCGLPVRSVLGTRYTPTIDRRARALLSVITVTQFVKLNAYTGMWFTFLLSSIYFFSWALQEVVFLVGCVCCPAHWLRYRDTTPSLGEERIYIAMWFLHVFCPLLAFSIVFLPDIEINNQLALWYWYFAVELPWSLFYGGICVLLAGLTPDSEWNVLLGWLWFFLMLYPVAAWLLACFALMFGGVFGPFVAIFVLCNVMKEDYKAPIRAVGRKFRNREIGVGLAIVGVVRLWSVSVFEQEGTRKVGWFAGWP